MRRGRTLILLAAALLAGGCGLLSGLSALDVDDAAPLKGDGGGPEATPASRADGATVAPDDGAAGSEDAAGNAGEAGARDGSPPTVRCNGTECAGHCCVSEVGATCAPAGEPCAGQAFDLHCDELGDCPSGSVCCLGASSPTTLRSLCQATCSTSPGVGGVLCASKSECGDGGAECVPLSGSFFPPGTGKGSCN